MGIDDENNMFLREESSGDKLNENNVEGDYPSFDQESSVTGENVALSGVEQENIINNQGGNAENIPSDSIAFQQPSGPMKITEEALESMKEQEKQEQEALLASQGIGDQLVEEPIMTEDLNDDITSTTDNSLAEEPTSLGSYNFGEERVEIKRYNTGFVFSVLGLLIFGGLSYVVYLFYQYLEYKSLPVVPTDREENVTMVSNYYDNYGQKLGLFNLETYKVIYLENEINKVDLLLGDSTLNFNQKKDDLQRSLLRLGTEIINVRKETKQLREKMNKEGFFPQELVGILDAEDAISSIQRSLISLEVVKFSSAMRVFSLMNDIVEELSNDFEYTRTNIKERLEDLINRGEHDVQYYLNVCYNNPYEPEECININDFDKYYKKISEQSEDKDFDTSFFKKLMKYINNQIEYNDLPSFSITFNSFNGKSNSITFSVEVNTTFEDEYALTQQGIKNPHIFIISELIKLLKQSTFIVGKAIDAKNIKVVPKIINVAGRQFNVQNSVNTYTLPIQKTTEREIFDFIETNARNLQDTGLDMSGFDMSGSMISGLNMTGFNMSGSITSGYDISGYNVTGSDSFINYETGANSGLMINEPLMTGENLYTGIDKTDTDGSITETGIDMIFSGKIEDKAIEEVVADNN